MDLSEQNKSLDSDQIQAELEKARAKMEEVYKQNYARMQELVALRNQQEENFREQQNKANTLELQAIEAAKRGDRDAAREFIKQKQAIDPALKTFSESLASTNQTIDAVTEAVKKQREQIENAAAEALLLNTQLEMVDIQNAISKTIEGMSFTQEYTSFEAGKSIVSDLQAEAAARHEVFGERMDLQIALLDESVELDSAEQELKRLEARIANGEITVDPEASISAINFDVPPSETMSDEEFLRSLDTTLEDLDLSTLPKTEQY